MSQLLDTARALLAEKCEPHETAEFAEVIRGALLAPSISNYKTVVQVLETARLNGWMFSRSVNIEAIRASLAAMVQEVERLQDEVKARAAEADLNLHKVLTCGVAASHPDPELSRRPRDYGGKWDSPQAQEVRKLRDRLEASEKDAARWRIARVRVFGDDLDRDPGSEHHAQMMDARADEEVEREGDQA